MARRHHELAARDPGVVDEVEVLAVLDRPAGLLQLLVDEDAGALLRGQARLIVRNHVKHHIGTRPVWTLYSWRSAGQPGARGLEAGWGNLRVPALTPCKPLQVPALHALLDDVAYTGWRPKSAPGRFMRRRYPLVPDLSVRYPGPWEVGQLPDGTLIRSGPRVTLAQSALLVTGGPPSLTGVTFGERLRLHYVDAQPTVLHGPTAGRRRALGLESTVADPVWTDLVDEANRLARLKHEERSPGQEKRLAQLCGVLALYQAIDVARVRTGAMADGEIALEPATAPVEELTRHVGEELTRTVVALMRLAVDRLSPPETVSDARAELRLGQGGGRADLVLDELLLEVKTNRTAKITAEYAYQLLDYLLGSPEVDISQVGWYFARHGVLWVFPVDEFLSTLAGGEVHLEAARTEYDGVF